MTAVGVIVALAQEGRSLTRQRLNTGQCIRLDHDRLLVVSDAGPESATSAAALLYASGAQALISWGCAGGLDPALPSGALIIPRKIIQSDGTPLATDPIWAERVETRLTPTLSVERGQLLETSAIVSNAEDKQRLYEQTGAVALDMESAAIARAASELKLPFLAVRAIVDPASVTLPSSIADSFDSKGHLHLPGLLMRCLTNPRHFIDVIQLGRHFDMAMNSLCQVDRLIGADLLCASATHCPLQ